ncbi:MAG TPA: hypothetical protein VHV77_10995, partial [Pirellulales bacterium]|nr:hypothetical protein [Pirellulales bacterium]
MEPELNDDAPQAVIAADDVEPSTFWEFVYRSVDSWHLVVLIVASVLSLVLIVMLLQRSRNPWTIGALLLLVPLPTFVGVFLMLLGFIQSGRVFALSP